DATIGGENCVNGLLERGENGGGTATRVGASLGLRQHATVGINSTDADARAADVDSDERSYAFFSSSFRGVSSAFASLMPFLNSFTLDPSDLASSGKRFAPNKIKTITRMTRSSW